MAEKRTRRLILAPAAHQDIRDVLRWSEQKFGAPAAVRYRTLITQALRDIAEDPERPGSRERPELLIPGARTYHLSLSRTDVAGARVKEPRHFLLFRRRKDDAIEVARLLHDGRDLELHLPESYRRTASEE